MPAPMDDARATLLRALDELGKAVADLDGELERADVVVIYSVGRREDNGFWHEIGGWASTGGPAWAHAAMCRRAADAHDYAAREADDDDDD
jgi:hypothetical protein